MNVSQATGKTAAFLILGCVLCATGCAGRGEKSVRQAPLPADLPKAGATPPAGTTASSISPEQARAALEAAANSQPGDPAARLELALFDLRMNNADVAEQTLRSVWREFPKYARAPYYLGMLYLSRGLFPEAAAPLTAAAAAAKTDSQIQVNAAVACFRAGRQEEARKFAEAAIRLDPNRPDPYLLMARLNAAAGRSAQAIRDAEAYIVRSPSPAPGHYLLGRIHYRQGDRVNSEKQLLKALQEDPAHVDGWVALGRVYAGMFGSTRMDDAERCFRRALEARPDHWEAHLALGQLLSRRKQYGPAVEELRTAVRLSPQPLAISYDLGQALVKAGRTDEGNRLLTEHRRYNRSKREYFEGFAQRSRAIEASPRDRSLRYALARFCLTYGQFGAAEMVLQDAARLLGEDGDLRKLRGEINGQREAAAGIAASPPSIGGVEHDVR